MQFKIIEEHPTIQKVVKICSRLKSIKSSTLNQLKVISWFDFSIAYLKRYKIGWFQRTCGDSCKFELGLIEFV